MQVTLAGPPLITTNYQDQGRVGETGIARAKLATIIAFLLAALHAVLAITAAMEKSPTFDEPTHLTAGYIYWLKNDIVLIRRTGICQRVGLRFRFCGRALHFRKMGHGIVGMLAGSARISYIVAAMIPTK